MRVPEKAAQVFTFTAFIWLREENKLVSTLGLSGKVHEDSGNYPCSGLLQRTPIRLTTSSPCWKLAPLPASFLLLCAGPRSVCLQILPLL